jgi:quinoprotein glucose dehydrogenase
MARVARVARPFPRRSAGRAGLRILALGVALLACRPASDPGRAGGPPSDWPAYGRDPGGSRHAPLAEITRENVGGLRVAWTHPTGDLARLEGGFPWRNASFEATPILVEGTLYLCSGLHRVIALDPETGAERWSFDPQVDFSIGRADPACRGVSSWLDPQAPAGATCRRRILHATTDARLFALDAASGAPCPGFGENGVVELARGIANAQPGRYGVTSPPAVVGDLVVTGSQIGDNQRTDEASGVVRAFDARTGRLRWAWDPIPRDATDPAWATWADGSAARTGAANAWAQLSADPGRDLLFVPTGSASPDFYGGERRGRNEYANSVVALRASTGQVVWHFQTVHHDLWDYDVPAQPTLVTVRRDGAEIPALAQATKMGHVFVLHRETGEPLFPVEERPVPASDVPGEEAWPTQPFPVRPPPLAPQKLSPEDAWGLTPFDRAACRERMESLRSEGIFTPPSLQGTIVFPGNAGGTNWGSVAFEPERGLLLVNTSRVVHVVRLVPRADYEATKAANRSKEVSPQAGTPYGMMREVLLSPLDLPCNPPPWGRLAAVDLGTGEIRWEVNLGTTRDLAPVPIALRWGTPNMGGPITTAGGLVFIGAAMDDYLRAFDVETGEELWKGRLPAGGQATPMTYRVREGGKQFVVIAAGGNQRMGTTLGDAVVAFSLP